MWGILTRGSDRNKQSETSPSRHRKLTLQSLEEKTPLAADIVFSAKHDAIFIVGDHQSDVALVAEIDNRLVVGTFDADGKNLKSFNPDKVDKIVFSGKGGNDLLINSTSKSTIAFGGAGNDILVGGQSNDILRGHSGNDVLIGQNGNDLIQGHQGNDVIQGSGGNDTIYGHAGNDIIDGGWGNDLIRGNKGHDIIFGNYGSDEIFGGKDNDALFGNSGDDKINGQSGNDLVNGGSGNDKLFGEEGFDVLFGELGSDSLSGGDDQDILLGGDQADILQGGNGNDFLSGGNGYDLLSGDGGTDYTFDDYNGAYRYGVEKNYFSSLNLTSGSSFTKTVDQKLGLNSYVPSTNYLGFKSSSGNLSGKLSVGSVGYKNPDAMMGAIKASNLQSLSIGGIFGKETTDPYSTTTYWD